MIKIGEADTFEAAYTQKFRCLTQPYGEFIKYERDRAAIDIGLHLIGRRHRRFSSLANTRVWFQLKGIRQKTLPLAAYEQNENITVKLEIEHLKFWYASPEATYLAVYVESADIFLLQDIRDLIDKRWGESIFNRSTFRNNQKKISVAIPKANLFVESAWVKIRGHQSLRIDGPSFRGRPLGHRLDPLRCIPNRLESEIFAEMIGRLLDAHGYKLEEEINPQELFSACEKDVLSISIGTMCFTYEWVLQMTTAFGVGRNSDFRIEGSPMHVQGPCAVLIHGNPTTYATAEALQAFAHKLTERGISQLLVFANLEDCPGYFGSFVGPLRTTQIQCSPQPLGDIGFNLLIATKVYLDFRDKISWRVVNYLW